LWHATHKEDPLTGCRGIFGAVRGAKQREKTNPPLPFLLVSMGRRLQNERRCHQNEIEASAATVVANCQHDKNQSSTLRQEQSKVRTKTANGDIENKHTEHTKPSSYSDKTPSPETFEIGKVALGLENLKVRNSKSPTHERSIFLLARNI
jgi:hypothetical protein